MSQQPNAIPLPRIAIVMAFDSRMAAQAMNCLSSIRTHCPYPFDACVVAVDLNPEQLQALAQQNAKIITDCSALPRFENGPSYAIALTCRPYIPQLFPDYDVYLYVDADIRICDRQALDLYLVLAFQQKESIVIAQEIDPSYGFISNCDLARAMQARRFERMVQTFGREAGERLQYVFEYNGGIFAMHRDSPVWGNYRRYLEIAMKQPYDHFTEQDALNLAVHEPGQSLASAPSVLNWLCAFSLPARDSAGRWVRANYPHNPIHVLHLINSNHPLTLDGQMSTWEEYYRRQNLPV